MNAKITLLPLAALMFCAGALAQDSTLGLLESGRLDSAMAQLEADLGENPYDAVALNNLAVARARSGEVFSALDLLDRAARLAAEQPTIAANRDALRDWIARRIDADRQQIIVLDGATPRLPAPPALWAR
ncbi:MAG TPA: hypothetical protein VGE51_07965 [Fontimonas sp.]